MPEFDKPSYADSHYLLFGEADHKTYNELLDCSGTKAYLTERGLDGGSLTEARNKRAEFTRFAGFSDGNDHYCDFCGTLLAGVEHDVLKDGRERCGRCSRTVVKGRPAFEALYNKTKAGLEERFGIALPQGLPVKVVAQAKLSRATGQTFTPTKDFDARAVGVAIKKKGSFSLWLENGTPRLSLIATTAHELTHIWQYTNWNEQAIKAKYGQAELAVYEGMAKWVEIQYLFLLNEGEMAERTLKREVQRTDVYGYGLRWFLNQYPISRGIVLEGDTPFGNPGEPIVPLSNMGQLTEMAVPE